MGRHREWAAPRTAHDGAGGLFLFGTGAMRRQIFSHYRPMVLGAMYYADRSLAAAHPGLDEAPVIARFKWRDGRADDEPWGRWGDWRARD